ncbi:MAG: ABC transporter permease [Nitrospiraceae bacterium]|nr:ABC transporter permease [Nitrospiraceae bacterium]
MHKKDRMGRYIKFFMYLVVIVLINLAGITLFFRIDLTRNRLYSISEESKHVVSTLSEPLTIDIFFTKDLPAPYNNIERYLHDLLDEYSVYANKYFNYHFYDVSPKEDGISRKNIENQKMARNYGINPVQIRVIQKDEVKFQKAYMGLVIIHGDLVERIPTITSTDGLEYRLTTTIEKLNNKISALLRLPGKVHVRLFMSSSLEKVAPLMNLKDLQGLPGRFRDIVRRLNKKNYGRLDFEYLDPTKNRSLETEVKKYNLLTLKWPAIPSRQIEAGRGSIGLVMQYRDKTVEIPLMQVINIPIIGTTYKLADIGNMERVINNNLESLININENIGYLADHGTLNMSPSYPYSMVRRGQGHLSNLRRLISQTYSIKDVRLKDGPIPESLNCLIIARPTKKFSDYELYQIDQFLMRGKSLCLFMDAFNQVRPPSNSQAYPYSRGPQYIPIDTNLEKLLDFYGVHIKKSYAMDKNCYKERIPEQLGGGERPIYFAPIIKSRFINRDLPFMKNIKGLIAFQVSPLELKRKQLTKNGLKAVRLISSSDRSWEMRGKINFNPMFVHPPQSRDEEHSLPLAYLITGRFPSYFAGRPIPKREGKKNNPGKQKKANKKSEGKKTGINLSKKIKEQGEFISRGRPGKIFIMASSYMLRDNLIDPNGRGPNATFIMNVIDHLNNRDETAAMRSKVQRFNPLYETGAGAKAFVKAFNIIGLPVLVIIAGLLVWFRRNSRKKRIKIMFQK